MGGREKGQRFLGVERGREDLGEKQLSFGSQFLSGLGKSEDSWLLDRSGRVLGCYRPISGWLRKMGLGWVWVKGCGLCGVTYEVDKVESNVA